VATIEERIAQHTIIMPNGCHEHQRRNTRGYGQIKHNGTTYAVHRLVWELANGPIPEGQIVRHYICDNPPCCDVAHLRPGTKVDNAADRFNHGHDWQQAVTHCPQGHEYNEANTYIYRGRRYCRACRGWTGLNTTA